MDFLPFPRYNSKKSEEETFGAGFGAGGNPADLAAYYWYGNPASFITSDTGIGIKVDYNFQIISVKVWIRCGVAGSSEVGSFEIGINRSDYASVGLSLTWSSILQSFATTGYTRNGNAGDIISGRIVCPNWITTNPTTVFMWAEITIKRR